ncbi:MAG: hypothetical protein LBU94_06115 [Clostridiales bacterium]|nr:hypothetical protein [Clostridiales bacterium]
MADRYDTNKRSPARDYGRRELNNSGYNNTSSAYDYAEKVHVPKPQKKIRKPRGSSVEVYVRINDKAAKPTIAVYGAIAIVFICAVISIVSASNVTTQRLNNSRRLEELKIMQSKTAEMTAEVSASMDLDEIERIARTKLEMSEPGLHQIVYINIPKQNYAVSVSEDADIEAETDRAFSFAGLRESITNWLGDGSSETE